MAQNVTKPGPFGLRPDGNNDPLVIAFAAVTALGRIPPVPVAPGQGLIGVHFKGQEMLPYSRMGGRLQL